MNDSIRLDRLFSNLGYGSRKEAAECAKAGRILLDGNKLGRASETISLEDARSGRITIDGEPIDPPAPLTVMLNKPEGYSCSHDEDGALVYHLLPERWQLRKPALSSAGRLDKYSTGQVILTDDGELLHRIIHPKSHASKQYRVTLEKPLTGEETMLFGSGTFLLAGDDKPLKTAKWTAESQNSGEMTLHEGRFHQIRRMFETIGNRVVELHRFQTGGLMLGDLPESSYRILGADDIHAIFATA